MKKQTFLESIEKGKWFHIQSKNKQSFLVKMKTVYYPDVVEPCIDTLWLTKSDWESMCFSEYKSNNWDIIDNQFVTYSSFVYHFGCDENSDGYNIYSESGELDVEKMKITILEHAKKDFISPEELEKMWELLQKNEIFEFEVLSTN